MASTTQRAKEVIAKLDQFEVDMALTNQWVHGGENQTVKLGGVSTPTIKNLVKNFRMSAQEILDAAEYIQDNYEGLEDIIDANREYVDIAEELMLKVALWMSQDQYTMTQMNLDRYHEWYDGEIDLVRNAGRLSETSQQRNRAFIDNFRQAQQLRKMQLEHAENLDPVLFIIAGQSNGMGATREGPTERAPDVAEFWNYTLDTPAFQPMKDPTTTVNFGSAWPEFCRTFFDLTGRKTIILNVSYSAASATGGHAASWAGDGIGVARAYAQAQYEDMMTAIAATSKPYVWGGLIWVQGEGDGVALNAGNITANDFKLATLDVLSWFRTLTGQANLPIFISQTGHRETAYNGSNPSLFAAEKQIQAVQEEVCADTSDNIYMAFTLAKTFFGCGMMNDTVHYNQKGYNLMGRSIAQCCANVLNF